MIGKVDVWRIDRSKISSLEKQKLFPAINLRWLRMDAGKADGNGERMERVEEAKGQTIKQLRSHGKRGSYII